MIERESKDLWATPTWAVKFAEKCLTGEPFDLDVAALPHNAKCARFITPEQDCLTTEWDGKCCWLNPPYSNPLPFVERAIEQSQKHGLKVVMLLNADTSTRWFAHILAHAAEIVFVVEGRMSFLHYGTNRPTRGNNRPQMFVVFDPSRQGQITTRYVSLCTAIEMAG